RRAQDESRRDVCAAIFENQIVLGAFEERAVFAHNLHARDDRADVAELPARVHPDSAADRAGDAGETFNARQALAAGAKDQLLHVHAGADLAHVLVIFHTSPVFLVEAEDSAIDTLIANEQIRAQAEHVNPDVVLETPLRRLLEFFKASWSNEIARRTTDLV